MRASRIVIALTALSLLARWPALANPDTLNSDVAVVGLQALGILRGEVSPLLWGSHYQTSVDAFVAALFFAVGGASAFALMLSALALHTLLTIAVYFALERPLGKPKAMSLSLLLVFTGAAVHSYALYPPRQAALTSAVLAIVLFERATGSVSAGRGPTVWVVTAGALATFSLFADPYALLFVPAIVVSGLLFVWRLPRRERLGGALRAAIGAVLGAIPIFLLVRHPEWRRGETGLSLAVVAKNARLFWDVCGPWAFGTAVYRPTLVMDYAPWTPSAFVRAVQVAGGTLLAASCFVAPAAAAIRRVPEGARRLGVVGGVLSWTTLIGFLGSVMVMDHFSMRYLAAAVVAAPLCLAPIASLLSFRTVALGALPMLLSGLIGGLASLGPVVSGAAVRHLPGRDDELALLDALVAAGVREGVADYWVSYRLTLLAGERLVVVPSHAAQDRHPAYRARVKAASRVAYIVDPYRSQEPRAAVEARLRASKPVVATVERGGMAAFIVEGAGELFR